MNNPRLFRISFLGFPLILLLSLLYISPPLMAEETINITIPPQIEWDGDTVYLTDIATITGADQETQKILSEIFIARKPSPGQFVRLNPDTIKRKISMALKGKKNFNLNMTTTKIVSTGIKISKEELIDKAKEYLLTQNLIPPEGEVFPISTPTGFYIPKGEINYNFTPLQDPRQNVYRVQMELLVDGKVCKQNITVTFRLKKTKPADENNHKTPIQDKDHTSSHTDTPSPKQKSTAQPLIKQGDHLEVLLVRKNLTITTLGTARDKAGLGDTLRVKLTNTDKILQGTLTGPRTVTVPME